jgi:hypothetical protein
MNTNLAEKQAVFVFNVSEDHAASISVVEDGGSIFLRNVSIRLQNGTASQPTGAQYEYK